MSQYGEIISPYEPNKENMYEILSTYFNNPIMTKVKDVNNHSMYICKVNAQLGIEYRYIIAFVIKDSFSVGKMEKLSDLYWISLQTRILKDEYQLPLHDYIPQRLTGLDSKIELIYHDEVQYKYKVDNFPIDLVLLPTKKSNNLQYNPNGTLITALETYQTILTVV